MDALSDADSCHRLGYDDFNESLSSKAAVRSVLALLGVSRAQIKGAETNDAFAALAVRAVWISQQLAALWKCSLARSMRQQLLSHHPPHTIISQQLLPREASLATPIPHNPNIQVWIGSPRSLAPLGGQFAPADLRAGFLRDATEGGRAGAGCPAGVPPSATAACWFSVERAAAFWSVQARGA